MKTWRVPVAKEGYPFILGSFTIALTFWFLQFTFFTSLFTAVTLFVILFFRDPERDVPADGVSIVAPADGKVIKAEEVYEGDHLKKRALKVSIFMTIFNVHVNRVPMDGEVVQVDYHPGKFFNASFDKASSENERNELLIRDGNGRDILLVQIAGLIARRIVCYLKEGNRVCRGERFGLIRFGSRLDIYLPPDTDLKVRVGDKVKAGETIIGSLG